MQHGIVKWFNGVKGYGFIVGDDGREAFVHQSNILMLGFRVLESGQHVRYRVEPTERGDNAVDVVIDLVAESITD